MVEQTRQPSRVVTLQAGPGEVNVLFDANLRINDRATRAVGRQLAIIGDQLDREWASMQHNWLPTPLHVLRPAQALTRTIYRGIHSQLWGFQGLSGAVKAWIASTAPGEGILRADTWMSHFKAVTCTGWTRGALVAVALVAAVTIFGALWVEQKA